MKVRRLTVGLIKLSISTYRRVDTVLEAHSRQRSGDFGAGGIIDGTAKEATSTAFGINTTLKTASSGITTTITATGRVVARLAAVHRYLLRC